MARRAKRRANTEDAEQDLDILHPERTATIGGQRIRVREYEFAEGLRLRPYLQPLLDDLHQQMVKADRRLCIEEIVGLLGSHADIVVTAIAKAADREPEWVAGLTQDEGDLLMAMWWGANGPFLERTVLRRVILEQQAATQRAGVTSMRPCSPPDTPPPLPPLEH